METGGTIYFGTIDNKKCEIEGSCAENERRNNCQTSYVYKVPAWKPSQKVRTLFYCRAEKWAVKRLIDNYNNANSLSEI